MVSMDTEYHKQTHFSFYFSEENKEKIIKQANNDLGKDEKKRKRNDVRCKRVACKVRVLN